MNLKYLKFSNWRGLAISAALILAFAIAGCEMDAESPTGLNWQSDLPQALAQAKTQHKLVLLDFTGSDWCPPCRQLNNKVFAATAFKAYADANLILVQLDFPRNKPQSDDLKKANDALYKQYDVEGYPTVILLDPDGKILKRTLGYDGASPASFIADLQQATPKH